MNRRGFSLIELVVVVTIIGILAGMVTLRFHDMMIKSNYEKEVRELHANVVRIRLSAIQRSQRTVMFFGPNQYTFKTYSSYNEPLTAGQAAGSSSYPYVLQQLNGAVLVPLNIATNSVEFDTRGLTTNNLTLVVTPVQVNGGNNCLVINAARTNIGRMTDATTCTIW